MRLEVALVGALALAGYASLCSRPGGPSDPTVPSVTPSPEPVQTVYGPDKPPGAAQDAGACPSACESAQTACRKNPPKPVAYCEAKCRDAAKGVSGPSLEQLAIMYTCNEDDSRGR